MNEWLEGLAPETVRQVFLAQRRQQRMSQALVAKQAGYVPSMVTRLEGGSWYPRAWNGYLTLERLIEHGLGMTRAEFVAACQEKVGVVDGAARG